MSIADTLISDVVLTCYLTDATQYPHAHNCEATNILSNPIGNFYGDLLSQYQGTLQPYYKKSK